jgi:hypothetical protein
MSDVSILSNEYERASALSKKLDSTLLDLKKERRGLPRIEESDAETVREKLHFLAQVLRAIALLLDPSQQRPVEPQAAASVPSPLVARLRAQHEGDLPYYVDDLARVADALESRPTQLVDAELRLLDDTAKAADAETSEVFRRLMRR